MSCLLRNARPAALRRRSYPYCQLVKVNQKLGEGALLDFNQGYLMMLPLQNLKCICGKRLGHENDHAICAACGLVTHLSLRPPAHPHATISGSFKETALIIKTTMKNLKK